MPFENPIFYVEKVKNLIDSGRDVEESRLRKAGEYLGTPLKRVEVFQSRYNEVFTRFIEKRCSKAYDEYQVCIYSWNRRRAFKSFPVSNYATGTVIIFRGGEPLEVLSTPLPKALDYIEGSEPVEIDRIPLHVSKRIDGWQVNAYYDKILGRWIFSTRYVLHNMYFQAGRLKIDPYGEISNPIILVADSIAREYDLYNRLERFRGWVFIFSLLGPEPAITSPPYPIEADVRNYKLYLIAARDSEGVLQPASAVSSRIEWDLYAEEIERKSILDLYREVRNSLTLRSYIAWFENSGLDPLLVEIPSRYYYDAMMVKHLHDAKSAVVLCSESEVLCRSVMDLVSDDTPRTSINLIMDLVRIFEKKLSETKDLERVSKEIYRFILDLKSVKAVASEEILKELTSGNIRRLVKKILSIVFEERSLASEDTRVLIDEIKKFLEKI
ncbi:MAG: hypothetical protein QXD76_01110 [Sulfolobales archaeon]